MDWKGVSIGSLSVKSSSVWALMAVVAAPEGAAAQEIDDDQGQQTEIIVTAQKRAQSVQDVPLSIQAISGEYLERTGLVDLADYARVASNVNFVPSGSGLKSGASLNIRGISPLIGEPTVAFYIDDTPVQGIYRAGGMDPRIYDIERVEILKGPQGHLYGSSAMGGVIKIVTRKPDLDGFAAAFSTDLSVTRFGSENFAADGMLNLPIVDGQLALRLVTSFGSQSGFIENVSPFPEGEPVSVGPPGGVTTVPLPEINLPLDREANSSNVFAVRGALLFEPNSWLSITPSVFFQRRKASSIDSVFHERFGFKRPRQSFFSPSGVETVFRIADLNIDVDLGVGTITSSSSYLDSDGRSSDDIVPLVSAAFLRAAPTPQTAAFINPLMNKTTLEQLSQEIRFVSGWTGPLDLVAGIYYTRRDTNSLQNSVLRDGGREALSLPTDLVFAKTQPEEFEEAAAFGNLTYSLGIFEIQAGLRYSSMSVRYTREADGLFEGRPTAVDFRTSEKPLTTSFSLATHLDRDKMIYLRAAQGFRPGLVRSAPPAAVCGTSNSQGVVRSDKTWNYEAGIKTQWADRRVTLNGTVFLIRYTDVQQGVLLPCGFTVFSNAGSATSKGFEVEFDAKLGRSLTLNAAVGYTKSTLDEAAPAVGGDEGESLVNVPKWTSSVGVEYKTPLGRTGYEGYARADARYVGSRTSNFGPLGGPPTDALRLKGYELVDFRLGVENGGWDFSVYVSNLLDKRAPLAIETFVTRQTYINRPRTIGLSVRRVL